MKKSIGILIFAVMLLMVNAIAEGKNSLSDFSSRLKKGTNTMVAETVMSGDDDGLSYGPAVKSVDPFFQKVQSASYLREDEYSKEMNVFIELKNTSGRTLYPGTATISAYNAAGELLEEKSYASVGPQMVRDGGSLYIWEWFYSPDYALSDVSYFKATVETETSSYTTYENIDAQALVDSGVAYTLIENTTENDIYGLRVLVAVENEEGRLLDVCEVSTGNAVGIFPGSIMILRGNVKDHEKNEKLAGGAAVVHAMHVLD